MSFGELLRLDLAKLKLSLLKFPEIGFVEVLKVIRVELKIGFCKVLKAILEVG